MAASMVDIMSTALTELGEDRIVSPDQNAERARVVSLLYEGERDAMLEEHPWKFATARATLARLGQAPAFGHAYAYALPGDCLHVLETHPAGAFRLEGGRILSDEPKLAARYVRRILAVPDMPAAFRTALAARLAARAAKKITGSSAEKERLEAAYRERLRVAKSRDAQGGGLEDPDRADPFGPNLFITSRR